MFALWYPDDMCYEMWEPKFIYTAKKLDSSSGLSVGALLNSKWQNHMTITQVISGKFIYCDT